MNSMNKLYSEDIDMVLQQPLDYEPLRGKSILITGSAGMIGSVLVDMFVRLNDERQLGTKLFLTGRSAKRVEERFQYLLGRGDITILEYDVIAPLQSVADNIPFDYIIHAASNTCPSLYASEPVESFCTNVFGTSNLLNHIKTTGQGKLILLSSVEIYGAGGTAPFKETDCGYIDCNTARASYVEGKRGSETLCQSYYKEHGVQFVTARLCRIYGSTLKPSDNKALSQFLHKGLSREDIILKSAGNQLYSFLYAPDACVAILYCMLRGTVGEAYNIASDRSDFTLKDAASMIAKKCGVSVHHVEATATEKSGYSKADYAIMDAAKLNKLGFCAKYDMASGLSRTIDILKGVD